MKRLVDYLTLGMAAFMDFGMGALVGMLIANMLGVEISLWHLAIAGILALLPDSDILPDLLLKRTVEGKNHHESFMHRPILMIPLCGIAGWVVGGSYWGIVAPLCLLWHYIHDSVLGVGGFPLFWPLTNKYVSWRGLHEPSFMPMEEWLERYWRVPSYLAVWEVSVGSLGLAEAVVMQTDILWLSVATFCVFFLGAWVVWLMHGLLRSR